MTKEINILEIKKLAKEGKTKTETCSITGYCPRTISKYAKLHKIVFRKGKPGVKPRK